MVRLIEIALFLTPFAVFLVWRLLAPPSVPAWLVGGLAAMVALMIVGLLLIRQQDAGDRNKAYVPAVQRDGRILEGHATDRSKPVPHASP